MKKQILMVCALVFAVLLGVGGVAAQGTKKMQGTMDMAAMKNDPHHKLMMAYMKSMSDFARLLRDQALTPKGPDADEAQERLQGKLQPDLATRCSNRAWIGRPRLADVWVNPPA